MKLTFKKEFTVEIDDDIIRDWKKNDTVNTALDTIMSSNKFPYGDLIKQVDYKDNKSCLEYSINVADL